MGARALGLASPKTGCMRHHRIVRLPTNLPRTCDPSILIYRHLNCHRRHCRYDRRKVSPQTPVPASLCRLLLIFTLGIDPTRVPAALW